MGVKAFDDLDDTGGGVQDLGKPDDVILERSLNLPSYFFQIHPLFYFSVEE